MIQSIIRFKKCFALVFVMCNIKIATAQVGIGNNTPHSSAVLDVNNNEAQGLLVPRLTNGQRNNAASAGAADGLLSYDAGNDNFYYYRQNTWQPIAMPQNSIVMWFGNPNNVPDGWALCNGRWYNPSNNNDNGTSQTTTRTVLTPNLGGRFIAGYSGSGSYASVGNTGGATNVTLNASQIPAHNHTGSTSNGGAHTHDFEDIFHVAKNSDHTVSPTVGRTNFRPNLVGSGVPGAGDTDGDGLWTSYFDLETESDGNHSHSFTTNNNTGGGGAHENRPPYYVLAFIMKL